MTIELDWTFFKWAGLFLALLSGLALFSGDLPDHGGRRWANGLRWIAWPLLLLWTIVFLIRGIWL